MSQDVMIQKFGLLLDDLAMGEEYLTLHFSPTHAPRKKRWRNYGLSADFLGDYFANFFPGNDDPAQPINRRDTIKASVSYIANELLENAVKYSDETTDAAISITLYLYEEEMIFQVVNYANQSTATQYKTFIQTLLDSDLDEVYLQQLEQSAMGSSDSQIGLLTMMQDYSAKFGWSFGPYTDNPQLVCVNVVARLSL